MQINKNFLEKSQVEFTAELSWEEFEPYLKKSAEKLSQEIKIEGFRPGKAPYDLVRQKVGEITILEEAANIAINKTILDVLKEEKERILIGKPEIRLTKLAQGNPMEYKVTVSMLPEITLGDYKDTGVKMGDVNVEESDVTGTLEQLREMRVREAAVERESREGDKAILDVEMFLDNVPVEGGQAKELAVVIGKKYFVPGFDKQVIGMKKDDQREFSLPYPEDHFQAHLAGKMVEFRVKMKQVFERVLPELDDEFAKGLQFNSAEDMKEQVRKNIEQEKKHKAEQKMEVEMLENIVGKSKFGDIPEFLIHEEAHGMLHELQHDIERQGGKFDDYLLSIKKTHDELLLDFMPEAVKRIKTILAMREIAKAEGIEVSEKEVDSETAKALEYYRGNKELEERVKTEGYKDNLRSMLVNRKVIERLKELNKK